MRFIFSAAFALLMACFADAATERWDEPRNANPIVPGYLADPSLVQHQGMNYLYGTLDPWGGDTLGCWESTDFKHWTYRELNWPTKAACTSPTSRDAKVWAPSVVQAPGGKFFMYVSVGSEVWVGTADHPLGPWRDANGGKPLIAGNAKPGFHMIDAEAFIDDDGVAYLYWGSGWEWKNGQCFAVKLRSDMVTFDGEVRDVTPTNYFEGPFMFKHGGRYYLTYSQGITIQDSYQVHYAVGDSPFGPFTEATTSPILVTDAPRNIVSPGHHALFQKDGHTYILYHRHRVPYVPGEAFRQTCVDEITFTAGGTINKVTPTHLGPPLIRDRKPSNTAAPAVAASASSAADALQTADRALDDNYATQWTAASHTQPSWLQLDLREEKSVAHTSVQFEYAWKAYHFVLQSSLDGSTWRDLADHREGGARGSPQRFVIDQRCRYLRLSFSPGEDAPTPSVIEWRVE